MIAKMTLAAGVLALSTLAAPQISAAATFTPAPGIAAGDNSLVETVRWRGRCRAWRRECALRHGWGGWRYRRCLARHACI